jgi:general secretion pathway protein C
MVNRYFAIANIFLMTAGVYLLVHTFYAMVTAGLDSDTLPPAIQTDTKRIVSPVEKPTIPISQYSAIVDRNLFNIISRKENASQPQKIDLDNLQKTNLKLKLWGTVTSRNATSYAIIEDTKTRKQNLFRTGDSIQNATVKMILREKIVLAVDNQDQILTMEKPVASKRRFRSGRKNARQIASYTRRISLNRARLENAMDNLGQLMSQATFRPYVVNGRPTGISISRIKPKAIFRRMRLRNGDVVTAVNGRSIDTVEDAVAIFQNLTTAGEFQLDVLRRGRKRKFNYQIR